MRRPGRGRGGILVVGEAPEVEAVASIKHRVDSIQAMRTTITLVDGGRWVDLGKDFFPVLLRCLIRGFGGLDVWCGSWNIPFPTFSYFHQCVTFWGCWRLVFMARRR